MSIQVLGSHKGIQLIRTEDGSELYYSTHTGKAAIGTKGLSRLLGCDSKTTSRLGVTLNLGKEVEMYTQQGIQGVTLFMQDEIALNYECGKIDEKYDAPWLAGRIKGHNNDNLGIKDGDRPKAFVKDPSSRNILTAMQLLQTENINKGRKEGSIQSADDAKMIGYQTTKGVMGIVGREYVKPRDFRFMPEEQQKILA